MEVFGLKLCVEVVFEIFIEEVIKFSDIEGEVFDCEQVCLLFVCWFGLDVVGFKVFDWNVEGVVEMMFDVMQNYVVLFIVECLFGWYVVLFLIGCSGMSCIVVGVWWSE